MRPATEGDRPMLLDWFAVYREETRSPNHETPAAMLDRLLPMLFLWERDGAPVSTGAIYRRIGYEPNGDIEEIAFAPR
jgi:hypothetical protein